MVKYIKESLQRPEEIANELFWLNKDNVVLDFDLFLRNNWVGSYANNETEDEMLELDLDIETTDKDTLFLAAFESFFGVNENDTKIQIATCIWNSFLDNEFDDFSDGYGNLFCKYFKNCLGLQDEDHLYNAACEFDEFDDETQIDVMYYVKETIVDPVLKSYIQNNINEIVDYCAPFKRYLEILEKRKQKEQDERDIANGIRPDSVISDEQDWGF